jgi:hypothetical protein
MSGDQSSGSHSARKRLATMAEMSPGYRPPVRGREERIEMSPERPSDPGTWRVRVGWLQSILGPVIGAAVAGGVIYGATLTRIEQLEARDGDITARLESVASESASRSQSLDVRVYAVEREGAVRETEARATTRALDTLAEEIRELRVSLQRRRP